jgi:hypothetical protein
MPSTHGAIWPMIAGIEEPAHEAARHIHEEER